MHALDRTERAHYTIRVRSVMEVDWATWFCGFIITHDGGGTTVLSGEVADRASFYELMRRSRDLGLTVVAVERQERP
jgi:hypothetical protein